jgi:hypothetical protein
MGRDKAEAAASSRSKQNWYINISYSLIILQAELLATEINCGYMFKGNRIQKYILFRHSLFNNERSARLCAYSPTET